MFRSFTFTFATLSLSDVSFAINGITTAVGWELANAEARGDAKGVFGVYILYSIKFLSVRVIRLLSFYYRSSQHIQITPLKLETS